MHRTYDRTEMKQHNRTRGDKAGGLWFMRGDVFCGVVALAETLDADVGLSLLSKFPLLN
jgi:hypothetical protein